MRQRVDAIKYFPADQALAQTHRVRGEVSIGEHHHKQLANSVFPHNCVSPIAELAPRGLRQQAKHRRGNSRWTLSSACKLTLSKCCGAWQCWSATFHLGDPRQPAGD